MSYDKTLSELWNLVDNDEFGEVAKMAIRTIQDLQEQKTNLNITIGRMAGKVDELGNQAKELAKQIIIA